MTRDDGTVRALPNTGEKEVTQVGLGMLALVIIIHQLQMHC